VILIPEEVGAGVGVEGACPGAGGGAAASLTDDNFPCAEISTVCPACINSPLLPSPVGTKITLPPRQVALNDPSDPRSIFELVNSPSVAPTTV